MAVKFVIWGLLSLATLVVLLALVVGDSPSNNTAQDLKPGGNAALSSEDTDGDGVSDSDDPDPFTADNRSRSAKQTPSLTSTSRTRNSKPRRRKPKPALTACDANIRIKAPQTTCGFAQNVFYGYWLNEHDAESFADRAGIAAYSPATGTTFDVVCTGTSKIVCRAGDGGYVSFPMAAVSAYTFANAEEYVATHELGDVPAPSDSGDQSAPAPSGADSTECDPNYEGACLDPNANDYDCEGGSGDGPEYTGRVEVVGGDPHDLDRDGDGIGCDA